jgi:hypothetical protein
LALILSETYSRIFDELLLSVADWKPRGNRDIPLTACWPESGAQFTAGKGVLVIGRATNGFPRKFNAQDLRGEEYRNQVVNEARGAAEQSDGCLSWVGGGSYSRGGTVGSRSAFWRVTRCLVGLVEGKEAGEQKDWAHHVAWSNLAKVAPAAGGNPATRLYNAQFKFSIAALQQEIAELAPGIVLLVAGESWYRPILDGLKLAAQPRLGSSLVRHIAHDGKRPWLCTERPDSRKSRAEGAFSEELIAAYHELRA